MASYRYQRGDRPLEGYTIEHAVGRGGFGEVYYAVSDSGKQVALKAVQNYEDIELRGSTHCMNLKSPHLVTIFDVRHSERGDPFVIMEYVSGPSLRELLDGAPEGLGSEKAAWFIREISKAVSLLHDNGIVHRDLKPHNVFFEDGYVMVGDYSLSKVITTSHRSGHTLTVGTVHYMAPEISLGRYDRTVDIYAMGVLLYEMLTGKPPFLGESMGEVLMKHMSQDADVSGLPQPFAKVVQKAMARDPDARFQSADEMVEALFGTDAIRDGVSGFDPGSLTMIARRAVEKSQPMPATVARDSDANKAATQPKNTVDQRERATGSRPDTPARQRRSKHKNNPNTVPFWVGQLISRVGARLCLRPYPGNAILWERSDELRFEVRCILAAAAVFIGSLGIISLCEATGRPFISPGLEPLYVVPLLALSMTVGAATAGWLLAFFRIQLPWFVIRGVYYAACGFPVFVLSMLIGSLARLNAEFIFALIMPVLVIDWRWITSSRRRCRVSVVPSLAAAAIALVASLSVLGNESHIIATVGLATTAAMATQLLMPFSERRSQQVAMATNWIASLEGLAECVVQDAEVSPAAPGDFQGTPAASGMNAAMEEHFDMEAAVGAAEPLVTDEDGDVWMQSAESDAAIRSTGTSSNSNESGESPVDDPSTGDPPRSRLVALVLSLLPLAMMPICGLHRFYAGKVFSGVLYLLTLGLFGVGQLIDVVLIALGEFRDAEGRLLTAWRSSPDELATVGEKVNSLSVVPSPRNIFNDGLAVLGGLALAGTFMIAFVLAIDVPEMIATDMFRGIGLTGSDLLAIFGTNTWPELLRELLQLFAGIMAVIATGLLLGSRRTLGLAHALRVPAAAIPFGITQGLLVEAFYRVSWSRVADGFRQEKVGLILEEFLRSNDFMPSCIGAVVAFCVGLLILSLPPRQLPTPSSAAHVRVKQEV
jgi:serine/threonine protein kinase